MAVGMPGGQALQIIIFDQYGRVLIDYPHRRTVRRLDNLCPAAEQVLRLARASNRVGAYLPAMPPMEKSRSVLFCGMNGFSGMHALLSDDIEPDQLAEQWYCGGTPVEASCPELACNILAEQDCLLMDISAGAEDEYWWPGDVACEKDTAPQPDDCAADGDEPDDGCSDTVRRALIIYGMTMSQMMDVRMLANAVAQLVGLDIGIPRRVVRQSAAVVCRLSPTAEPQSWAAGLSVWLLLSFMALRLCGVDRILMRQSSSSHHLVLACPSFSTEDLPPEYIEICKRLSEEQSLLLKLLYESGGTTQLVIDAPRQDAAVLSIKRETALAD